MLKKRCQAAVELIIILAIALVILSIIISLNSDTYTSVSGQFEATKARTAVDDLADAAKLVYQQGVGSRTKIFVTLPSNIIETNVTDNLIAIKLYAGGNEREVYRTLDFDVSGEIPTGQGNYWLYVEAQTNYVSISEDVTAAVVCGNNNKEGSEECDGSDLNSETCASKGYDAGTLACHDNCTFNYGGCISYVCGNDLKEGSEICDGTDLDSETCISQGYISGNLSCLGDCTGFNYSLCIGEEWETIFFDDFNRANNNLVGGSWTETGGAWDILSNRAHADNCDNPGDQITSANINLSGKTQANLTFDWEYSNLDNNECLSLDLNDGTGWVNEVFKRCSTGSNQDATGSENINLLDYMSLTATVQLRYDCLSSRSSEEVYIDNVNMTAR